MQIFILLAYQQLTQNWKFGNHSWLLPVIAVNFLTFYLFVSIACLYDRLEAYKCSCCLRDCMQ